MAKATPQEGIQDDWPVSFFGKESVIDLRSKGNATFARGAFGEISVALGRDPVGDTGLGLRLLAIKTIVNATVYNFANTNSSATLSNNQEAASPTRKPHPGVWNEIYALATLQAAPDETHNRNICKLVAFYPTQGSGISFATEYCPTDLYITSEWRRRKMLPLLGIQTIRTMASDLWQALGHCHDNGILHCDVKPANILVSMSGVLQLCDFGLSRRFGPDTMKEDDDSSSPHGLCTLHYRPPEILLGGNATDPSVDVYSAGVVLAELVAGRTLFPGQSDLDQLSTVISYLGTPSSTHWPEARDLPHGDLIFSDPHPARELDTWIPRALESPGLVHFIQSSMTLDPGQRATCQTMLDHPWLSKGLAPRSTLQIELIPIELDEPFVLEHRTDPELKVPIRQSLDLAATKRSFFRSMDVWTGDGECLK